MNYEESLEYIHSVSWTFCKPGLERIMTLCSALGNPQNDLKFIHIAGTNGKGSFSSMLDSVLRAAGYRVGLFTSPYIRYFNERMCIDGEPISCEELAEITSYVRPFADKMSDAPTEFELITAIGFEYFKRNKCDVVILEAGMGGRLDSTNIIKTSVLSVITGVSLDHTAYLGDTTQKIAEEKAGIIKNGVPVLFGGEDITAKRVIKDVALSRGSEFYEVDHRALQIKNFDLNGSEFDFGEHKDIKIKLLGAYQPRNAANVLTAIDILRARGFDIPQEKVKQGLFSARWQGRFEVLLREPLVIFDGAHNPEGIDYAVKSIKDYFGDRKIYLFTGVLRDKDYGAIAKELSSVASRAFVVTVPNPRALPSDEYAAILSASGVFAESFSSNIENALRAAKEAAKRDSVPLICLGSLYLYCEIIKFID